MTVSVDGVTEGLTGTDSSVTVRRVDMLDGNVSKLVEVSGTVSTKALPRTSRVRPQVDVSSTLRCNGNNVGHEVGEDQVEVVRSLAETLRVLVRQAGEGNRGTLVIVVLVAVVVRPLTSTGSVSVEEGGVLVCPDQVNDRVRKTEVLRDRGTGDRNLVDRLDLLDEDITGGITHLKTLVVVNHNIVSIQFGIDETNILVEVDSSSIGDEDITNNSTIINNNKNLPVTERELDVDIVVGESSDRESKTSVLTKPEGKDDRVESTISLNIVSDGTCGSRYTIERSDISNHILVSNVLGGSDTKLLVEVKPVRIELLEEKLVKLDLAGINDVVHKLASPADLTDRRADKGEAGTEPHSGDVISGTVENVGHTRVVEINSTLGTEGQGNVREPVTLGNSSDELGNSVGSTIEEGLHLGESRHIGECDLGHSGAT